MYKKLFSILLVLALSCPVFANEVITGFSEEKDLSILNEELRSIRKDKPDETTWTDYSATSTVVGWSSFTTKLIYTKKIGKTVIVTFYLGGTSNATGVTFTLPYTSANTTVAFGGALEVAQDNGSNLTTACRMTLPANSATVTCYKDMIGAAWTNSNEKTVRGTLIYITD